jgi:hypothetical protein
MFWLVVSVVILVAATFFFPRWFSRFAWWRCLTTGLLYGRWSRCTHRAVVLRRLPAVTPDLPERYALVCPACQTIFYRDTWEYFQEAIQYTFPPGNVSRINSDKRKEGP